MHWTARRFGALIAAATLLRIALAILLPVSGDEAEYWDMSRHPALAYLDHPPLLFWLMIPFRWLFGETSLAIRMPSIVSSAALGFLLIPLSRRLGGTVGNAAYGYLILLATPFFLIGSFYAWTDALLITFYVAATLGAVMILRREARGWWVFALALGFGFLAKFPIVLAISALAPAILARRLPSDPRSPEGRLETDAPRRIQHGRAAPAVLTALLITAPVWIWSWQHDWVNFRFQFLDRHASSGFQPSALFDFLGAHLLLFTPFIAIAIGIACVKAVRTRDPSWMVVVLSTVTPLIVFALSAMRARAGAHWGAPGLVVGCMLVALIPFRGRSALVRAGAITCAVLVGSAAVVLVCAERLIERDWRYPFSPVSISTKYLAYAIGNDEIASEALARLAPGEMVATENYTNAHLWAFLTEGRLPTRLAWLKKRAKSGLPSLYWYTPGELRGRNFLFLTEKSGFDGELRRIFASVTEEQPIQVVRGGRVVRSVRALRCRNLLLPEGTFTMLTSGQQPG